MYTDCPYCGEEQEINHDDGYGYDEDQTYKQRCCHCAKTFAFTTTISVDYDATKAECLNGGEHAYKKTNTVPRRYTKMRCINCGDERPLTDNETIAHNSEQHSPRRKPHI